MRAGAIEVKRFFSIYWVYHNARSEVLGEPLNHAAGSFVRRGIRLGDDVYVFTGTGGRLILMGKMEVGDILDSDEAVERLLGFEPWSAPDHLIASACTPIQREPLPIGVGKELRFVSPGGKVALSFDEEDWLDLQSMRGVRQLELATAERLDTLLPPLAPYVPGQMPLGVTGK